MGPVSEHRRLNTLAAPWKEITRHVDAGKLAIMYSSNAPDSSNKDDQEQWSVAGVRGGLPRQRPLHEFSNDDQFRRDFGHHLSIKLNKSAYASLERPPGSIAASEPVLSENERQLLAAIAADTNGSVLHGRTVGGLYVQTSGSSFGDGTPRGDAAVQQALKRLRALGYVTPVSDEMDERAGDGYARADGRSPGSRAA